MGTSEVHCTHPLPLFSGNLSHSSPLPLEINQLASRTTEFSEKALAPHNVSADQLEVEDRSEPISKPFVGLLSLLDFFLGQSLFLEFSKSLGLEQMIVELNIQEVSGSNVMDGLHADLLVVSHQFEYSVKHKNGLEEFNLLQINSHVKSMLFGGPFSVVLFHLLDSCLNLFGSRGDVLALGNFFPEDLNVVLHKFFSSLDLLDNLGHLGPDVGLFLITASSLSLHLNEELLDETGMGLEHSLGDGIKDSFDLFHLRKILKVGGLLASLLSLLGVLNSIVSILEDQENGQIGRAHV